MIRQLVKSRKLIKVRRGGMEGVGERQNDTVHPSFDRSISFDFKGAKTGLTGIALVCFDGHIV
jgi:hypothetical protein